MTADPALENGEARQSFFCACVSKYDTQYANVLVLLLLQRVAYLEHIQRNSTTHLPSAWSSIRSEMGHRRCPAWAGCIRTSRSEIHISACRCFQRVCHLCRASRLRGVGEIAWPRSSGSPAKCTSPLEERLLLQVAGKCCTSILAWRISGDDGASHGTPVLLTAPGQRSPADQSRAGYAQRSDT